MERGKMEDGSYLSQPPQMVVGKNFQDGVNIFTLKTLHRARKKKGPNDEGYSRSRICFNRFNSLNKCLYVCFSPSDALG